MAHELMQKDTMFYVREVPWHGLGQKVDHNLRTAEAIKAAGLDWQVASRDIYFEQEVDGGAFQAIPGRVCNVRADTLDPLGIVSDRYRIVQNSEAFAWTDELLGSNGAHWETAGSLFNNCRVWMLAKLDEITVLGDTVDPYLVFMNSHDGSTGVKVAVTPIRVVCNNTLTAAIDGAKRVWSCTHTGNMQSKLAEARRTISMTQVYLDALPVFAEKMDSIELFRDDYERILAEMFPLPPLPPGEKKHSERTLDRVERQKDNLMQLYNTAKDLQTFGDTGWRFWNAVSDYGHLKPLRESAGYQEARFAEMCENEGGAPLLAKAQKVLMEIRRK